MSSFNLVQIVPSLDSGGVERGTIDVANFLSEKKIKNYIITQGGKMINEIDHNYTEVYKLPVNSKFFIYYPYLAKKINSFLIEKKINIVHVRSRGPAWIIHLIRNKNIKTISTFHNIYGGNFFIKKFYNKGMSYMNYIVANSVYVKESIVKKYNIDPKRISVINRGIDTDFFDENIDIEIKNKLLSNLKIDKTKKIILYPGRLTEWKGQLEFLDVIKKINTKKLLVLFVGDTKNKSYTKLLREKIIEKNLKDICMVVGNLNASQLKFLYSKVDLSVSFPLQPEGFGRTVSESLYLKTPVLAFDYGGVKNQLQDFDNIMKTEPLNYKNLHKKIDNLINLNEEEKNEVLKNTKNLINKKFSKKQMVNKYFKLYESIKF